MADRSVVYRLRADVSQFRAQMAAASASVRKSADDMTAATKQGAAYRTGLLTVGTAAGKVGLVAGAGLAAVVVAAANFDKAMSSVQAATHETAGNMGLLRAAALEAGRVTKYSATEAASGVEALAKAGVSTKDILDGGLTGALSLAAAGNQSVGDAAETAASAMTQFGLSGAKIPHIADLLAAGAGKAQGEVSDLAMALNQTGLVASQTGLSIEETTAGLSAFASAGLIGSDAGTSFKTMLLRLTPTSEKAKNLMAELGISAYDAQGQFIGLSAFAGNLQTALKDMSAEQRNATLQTIFGQDAVRAANVLYNQGAQGIDEWTTKVNAQGYAAETAAIKMDNLSGDLEQLRGSLETALIGTGSGSQGPLRSLVQGLTDVTNAYLKLPQAGKNAAAGVLAVTAVAGGGLFVFSRIVRGAAATRVALEQLGLSSTVTAGRLALFAKAATGVGLAVAAIDIAGSITRSFDKAAPSVDHLSASLLDLNGAYSSASVAAVTSDLGDLGDALKSLDAAPRSDGIPIISGLANNVADARSAIDGLLPWMDDTRQAGREAAAGIDALDQSLAGMVAGGNADVAAQTFDRLAQTYHLTADEQAQLKALLPGYADALDASANAATLAKGATSGLGNAAGGAAPEVTKLDKALEASRKSAGETAHSFITLGNGLNNAKVSLQQWIRRMASQAEALRNFRLNALKAAHEGLDKGLIASLQKAGPEGALRMRQLANATKSEIAKANASWREGQRQIRLYTDAVGGVPKTAKTKVTADTNSAIADLHATNSLIASLPRVVNVHVNVTRNTNANLADLTARNNADGGTIDGARHPYGDKVLSWLAPGEEVISNRYGQADRFRADRASGRIPRYADGGTVGTGGGLVAERGLKRAIEELKKAIDANKATLDKLREDRKQVASTVAGNFRSELFGDAGIWGSTGSPDATLKQDIAQSRAFNRALHQAARKGLSGGAFRELAESGNLQAAQFEASQSRSQIAATERLYAQRQRITQATGRFAGQTLDGAKIEHLEHTLHREMVKLREEVAHLRKDGPKNADRSGHAMGDALDHKTGKAARRARR